MSERRSTFIPACFIEFDGDINLLNRTVGGGAVLTYPDNTTYLTKVQLKIDELDVEDGIKYAVAAMRALLLALGKAREKGYQVIRATTTSATKLEIYSWRPQNVALLRELLQELDQYTRGCSFFIFSTTEFNRPMEVVTGLVTEALGK